MKMLRVTLDIPVLELSDEDKEEARGHLGLDEASQDGEDEDETEYFDIDCYSPSELAEVIEGAFHEETIREMFAGSNMYVTFGDTVSVVSAEWVS